MVRKEVRNSIKKVGSSRLDKIIFSPVRTVPPYEVLAKYVGRTGVNPTLSKNLIAAWHQIQS